jgi:hypothetical protein
MSLSIGDIGSLAPATGTAAAAQIVTSAGSQADAAQGALVTALFGSLGIGTHTDTTA